MPASFLARSLLLFALAACGARSTPPPPSNRIAVPPDAGVTAQDCYPYVRVDGACLTKCDWSKPYDEQGCVRGDWPLICNSDGTCTPEMDFNE